MRSLLVICLAAVFHSIFVASRGNEDHEVGKSMTTRDVKCKVHETDCMRLLHDPISMTPISSDEEDDYKIIGRSYPSRGKRRTTHRPRVKSNAKSRTGGMRGNKGAARQTDRVLPAVRISNETSLYENDYKDIDIPPWNQTSRNDDADDIPTYDHESPDDHYPFHGGLESLLTRLIKALENNSGEDNRDAPKVNSSAADDDNASSFDDEDRCQKWLDNREKIEGAFPGSVADLPACPCQYPNSIFYDNQVWDRKREKNFRWRDVSHDKDRLAIYKPGAVYCVQTLPSQESESAIAQHCCYDGNRKLLTRGSGAGTPYIVSPDISLLLHDKIDLLPWRLCKGDFTRYNEVRVPNNGNDCEINPDDEEYEHQVENAKNY